jgi:hypothetical protein
VFDFLKIATALHYFHIDAKGTKKLSWFSLKAMKGLANAIIYYYRKDSIKDLNKSIR